MTREVEVWVGVTLVAVHAHYWPTLSSVPTATDPLSRLHPRGSLTLDHWDRSNRGTMTRPSVSGADLVVSSSSPTMSQSQMCLPVTVGVGPDRQTRDIFDCFSRSGDSKSDLQITLITYKVSCYWRSRNETVGGTDSINVSVKLGSVSPSTVYSQTRCTDQKRVRLVPECWSFSGTRRRVWTEWVICEVYEWNLLYKSGFRERNVGREEGGGLGVLIIFFPRNPIIIVQDCT